MWGRFSPSTSSPSEPSLEHPKRFSGLPLPSSRRHRCKACSRLPGSTRWWQAARSHEHRNRSRSPPAGIRMVIFLPVNTFSCLNLRERKVLHRGFRPFRTYNGTLVYTVQVCRNTSINTEQPELGARRFTRTRHCRTPVVVLDRMCKTRMRASLTCLSRLEEGNPAELSVSAHACDVSCDGIRLEDRPLFGGRKRGATHGREENPKPLTRCDCISGTCMDLHQEVNIFSSFPTCT